jgi:hypothetical protein
MAGRVQLATTGTQDVFFTENPEYTHFIKQFRKHTNFAMYDVKHDVSGEIAYGSTVKCTIPAGSGDLLKGVRVHVDLPALNAYQGYNESIGHAIIEYVNLSIGGQLVQRIPRDWLQIYSEHYITQTKQTALSKLIGKYPGEDSGTTVGRTYGPSERVNQTRIINEYLGKATASTRYIVDIPFYFHNNPELALPICALTQQECEIEIKLSEVTDCIYGGHLAFTDSYDTGPNFTVTVVQVNGVNKYHIDGVDRPSLTLKRGSTYTFTIGKTLNEAHPFKLGRYEDGRNGGVLLGQYTTGITVSTFGDITTYTFVVSDDNVLSQTRAPSVLYYYCASHPLMGGEVYIGNSNPLDKSSLKINDVSVHTELVQLDEPERVKLQSGKNEYIISQLQRNVSQIPVSTTHGRDRIKCRLNFTNPVKELYFVIARKSNSTRSVHPFDYDHSYFNYPPGITAEHVDEDGFIILNMRYINYEHLVSLEMTLDNEVVLDKITGNVINMRAVQSGIHHSRTQLFRRFYSYSFALEPERWYPTGQKNFSMIKDQNISLILNNDVTYKRELRVYALSNNILRIQNGAGRLIFPNGPIGD